VIRGRNESVRKLSLLLLFVCLPLAAHEIGTTQVRAELRKDHTYRIDVITAPQALLNRLEKNRSQGLSDQELQARLQRLAQQFANAVDIRFGEKRSTPKVSMHVGNGAVIIRLTGDVPVRAGAFTWKYALIYSTYALTIEAAGQEPRRIWLEGDERSAAYAVGAHIATPTRFEVVRQYFALGFTHIVPLGLDHILFVLGMFLLTPRLKPVLTQVTTFTIAHSITLGCAMYGLVALSPRVVEPMIALSIAWVAIENLTTSQLRPWRVAIVFAFGLLHGMGFAGVLRELGLPRAEFVPALISFNVGVECGQLAVISIAYLAIVSWAQRRLWYRPRVVVPASMAIAVMGVVWAVERIAG